MPTRAWYDILTDRVRGLEAHLGRPVRTEDGEVAGSSGDFIREMDWVEQDALGEILVAMDRGEEISERLQKLNQAISYRLAIVAVNGIEDHGSATGTDE
jgi:hypothetical protein